MDLLVLPDGPRIRDKISHGEVCINSRIEPALFFSLG